MNKKHYHVTGGIIHDRIKSFFELRKKAKEEARSFAEDIGASELNSQGSCIVSAEFNGPPPKGWVKHRKGGYRPSETRQEMKEVRERMQSIRYPGSSKFQSMVMTGTVDGDSMFTFMDGLRCHFMECEPVKDGWLLSVPDIPPDASVIEGRKNPQWEPPGDGCRRLKMSEYWQIKEREQPANDALCDGGPQSVESK
jgi:hypothetical protein